MMYQDEMDEMIAHHALIHITRDKIHPCSCGTSREIVSDEERTALFTHCQRCDTKEPFNMADLVFLSGALMSYASGETEKLTPPNVSYWRLWKMIEDTGTWIKDVEAQIFRNQLKVFNGGLSSEKKLLK